ncbi:tetratricopeptide repeat protein [Bernardetia sp. OM2101]|uniref:tetratricopeptide repeat protein n=1 Tax=Bernardetia sp. OM2101 TaxID=3344876 RepID=UPI0035CEDCCB
MKQFFGHSQLRLKVSLVVILWLGLFLYGVKTMAQNLSIEQMIEQVYQLPENKKKVDMLNDIAKKYYTSDLENTQKYAQEAISLAQKIKYWKGEGLSNSHIGIAYYYLGKYEESKKLWLKSLELYQNCDCEVDKAGMYNKLGNLSKNQGNYSLAFEYFDKSLKIRQAKSTYEDVYATYNNIGNVHFYLGDYPKTIEVYLKSLKIAEDNDYKFGIGTSLSNLGVVYERMGENQMALDYYKRSLKIKKEIDDKRGMAISYSNIGLIELDLKNKKDALIAFQDALKILTKDVNDARTEAYVHNNIAELYLADSTTNSIKIAKEHLKTAKSISQDIGDQYTLASSYIIFARAYQLENKYDSAEYSAKECLKIAKEIQAPDLEMTAYENLSTLYEKQNKYDEAYTYYKLYAKTKNDLLDEEKSSQITKLNAIYDTQKKEKEILELNQKNILNQLEIQRQRNTAQERQAKLSLIEKENELQQLEFLKKQALKQAQYNLLKKEKELERNISEQEKVKQDALLELKETQLNQKNYLIWGLSLIAILLVGAGILAYRNILFKRRTNNLLLLKNQEINQQKEELETITENLQQANEEITVNSTALEQAFTAIASKNTHITASINYAQRIQQALLPLEQQFKQLLQSHFVFFKPRDIVSGDFYWIKEVENKIWLAVSDCTGHGVPGAFMSMLGTSALNNLVLHNSNVTPANILKLLDKEISESLHQATTKNRDGMDIALCCIDKEKNVLTFAGANSPIIYIQNGNLNEIKGVKQAIAGYYKKKTIIEFEDVIIPIQKDTTFYLFSDGYKDQFGGEHQKKVMSKRFKNLLLENHNQELDTQKEILEDFLEDWKGNEDQIDDILVVGFKV